MKDLVERIISIKAEIKELKYKRNEIHNQIQKKEDVLEDLEKLTVDQLDLFKDDKV